MTSTLQFAQQTSSRLNIDLSKSGYSTSFRQQQQFGSSGISMNDLTERRIPISSSIFAPGISSNNENDISKSYLSMNLIQNDQEVQQKQAYQQQITFPKLIEKSIPFDDINYIKISRLTEESPFFWNENSSQLNQNNNCYEVCAKDQFGKILARKKLYSKYNQDLEKKINEIGFMQGFRQAYIGHIVTVLSQMHNSNKNLKNGYYIQKMDDGEYHGSVAINNVINGIGIYYYNDGTVYEGELQYRKKHHRGTLDYPDGSKYQGGFVDDLMCGQAVFTDQFKSVFRGYFKDGVKEGQGKITYKNGEVLEGNWVNGFEEGKFSLQVGVNSFQLDYERGNIVKINGISIDKVPKDCYSEYTQINIAVLPQQIVINEYLKPMRQRLQKAALTQKEKLELLQKQKKLQLSQQYSYSYQYQQPQQQQPQLIQQGSYSPYSQSPHNLQMIHSNSQPLPLQKENNLQQNMNQKQYQQQGQNPNYNQSQQLSSQLNTSKKFQDQL